MKPEMMAVIADMTFVQLDAVRDENLYDPSGDDNDCRSSSNTSIAWLLSIPEAISLSYAEGWSTDIRTCDCDNRKLSEEHQRREVCVRCLNGTLRLLYHGLSQFLAHRLDSGK